MKIKHLSYILLCFFFLSSCSVIKKTFRKTKASKSEQVVSKSDSIGSNRIDSAHVIKSDSTGVSKKEESKEAWWQIEIDSTQPSTVEITQDSAGNQVVKATGKIKSVKGKSSKRGNSIDSVHKVNTDSLRASIRHTAKVSKSEKKESHESVKQSGKDIDKTRVLPGIGVGVAIGAILLLIYGAYRLYKFIKP
jgi:hypothetical protein